MTGKLFSPEAVNPNADSSESWNRNRFWLINSISNNSDWDSTIDILRNCDEQNSESWWYMIPIPHIFCVALIQA